MSFKQETKYDHWERSRKNTPSTHGLKKSVGTSKAFAVYAKHYDYTYEYI